MTGHPTRPLLLAFASPVEPSLVAGLRGLPGVIVEQHRPLEGEALAELACRATILVTRSWQRLDAALLAKAARSGLRAVVQGSAGRDNVDLDAAERAGVRVAFADPGNATAVAELTLLSLLVLFREPRPRWTETASGGWPDRESVRDRELRGKTLGLVGLGRVGRRVARRAAAFEMRVLAVDPYIEDADFDAAGAARVPTLDAMLPLCHALSLHCPLTDETRALLGLERLRRLRRGAFVLNTARGGILVEDDLRLTLDEGHLAGAMIDVYEREPPPPGGIHEHQKVLATPHLAGHTLESHAARDREMLALLESLVRELAG